ncbi:hypothetical protein BCR32DRAFT_279008 [Anaeromyces robustus]|uniref:Uncharacterized protein n=1 Tax=Anaeromyces robustus TaxID=1754192 RepID=A0A1Y1X971_9FUNG|nr:hypothetical protein BCR32DRAFT_279008 [Anaeromyces robustus]|eukprot:ORX82285.1 hypothetical protein BCR32DRAFT_279008 [Anaeromyces robustus]
MNLIYCYEPKFNIYSNWASMLWIAIFYNECSNRGTRVDKTPLKRPAPRQTVCTID